MIMNMIQESRQVDNLCNGWLFGREVQRKVPEENIQQLIVFTTQQRETKICLGRRMEVDDAPLVDIMSPW